MLLLQERMRALERLEPTDPPRRGHLPRPPLPAEDPGAHFLPPPRQHERMNVERGGHRLHLHTTLPTEAHRGQLELGAVRMLDQHSGWPSLPLSGAVGALNAASRTERSRLSS